MPESIAHYQLLEPMGAGTLGSLYRARDLQRGRTVALRVVDPTIASDPVLFAALRDDGSRLPPELHPGIAAIYEAADADGRAYVASEYVQGQTLRSLVSGSPLHPRRAVELAVQLADALAAAHGHGLVHGALDATSIIVSPKGVPKVLDVGMHRWTRARSNPPDADAAGLAAVLFEMLMGRVLTRGWPAEFRQPAIPAGLQVILASLSSGQSGEHDSLLAVAAAALRDVAASLEAARPDSPTPAAPAASRGARGSGRVFALLGLGLLLVGVLWWWLRA